MLKRMSVGMVWKEAWFDGACLFFLFLMDSNEMHLLVQ